MVCGFENRKASFSEVLVSKKLIMYLVNMKVLQFTNMQQWSKNILYSYLNS